MGGRIETSPSDKGMRGRKTFCSIDHYLLCQLCGIFTSFYSALKDHAVEDEGVWILEKEDKLCLCVCEDMKVRVRGPILS